MHAPDSFVFKTDRPWPNPALEVAAVVGHATPDSARLWLRTGGLGNFMLLLYLIDEEADADARSTLKESLGRVPLRLDGAEASLPGARREDFAIEDEDSDTTIVLDLEDIAPDIRYGYVLHSRDDERVLLGHNRLRSFRTPPRYDERRPFQFALFPCHMPYRQSGLFGKRTEVRNLEMWDYLGTSLQRHAGEIDLVIAGGDQCYADGVQTLDIWRYLRSQALFINPLKQRLKRSLEIKLPLRLPIWNAVASSIAEHFIEFRRVESGWR